MKLFANSLAEMADDYVQYQSTVHQLYLLDFTCEYLFFLSFLALTLNNLSKYSAADMYTDVL